MIDYQVLIEFLKSSTYNIDDFSNIDKTHKGLSRAVENQWCTPYTLNIVPVICYGTNLESKKLPQSRCAMQLCNRCPVLIQKYCFNFQRLIIDKTVFKLN